MTFSIRVRIESLATPVPFAVDLCVQSFQYPRSDRITCNRVPRKNCRHRRTSFSIRVRIESLATIVTPFSPSVAYRLSVSAFGSNHLQQRGHKISGCSILSFSIRVRIESLATCLFAETRLECLALSVSAFGSNHLQRRPGD